ncbi:MAG: hypothetical protein ACI88C_000937 [Acidimicrobiales bacterium]
MLKLVGPVGGIAVYLCLQLVWAGVTVDCFVVVVIVEEIFDEVFRNRGAAGVVGGVGDDLRIGVFSDVALVAIELAKGNASLSLYEKHRPPSYLRTIVACHGTRFSACLVLG